MEIRLTINIFFQLYTHSKFVFPVVIVFNVFCQNPDKDKIYDKTFASGLLETRVI